MDRIRNTMALARASWHVLLADKELLVLPVMSFGAALAVGASFLVPAVVIGDGLGRLALFALGYLALAYVTIFFNAALIEAGYERLSGGDPTLGGALRAAAEHAGQILAWSAVSATVSVLLKQLEGRGGMLGALVGSLAGMAWSLITFLVLPVLVVEGVGVRDALGRSAELFRATWGENVAARVGFGLVGIALALAGLPVLLLAGSTGSGPLIVAAIVVVGTWWVLVAVVMAALNGIFQAALYCLAAHGEPPAAFAGGGLERAFAKR